MTEDWSDALVALQSAGARFMVIGAHALAVHGVPRAPQDLDVWVDPTDENAAKVWDGLVRFGAPLEDLGIPLPRAASRLLSSLKRMLASDLRSSTFTRAFL